MDTLILTATARLARHLRRKQAGNALILLVDDWFEYIRTQLWPDCRPLQLAQRLYLWESIIEQDSESASLLDLSSLAQAADEAFTLQCFYGQPPRHSGERTETQAFARWSQRFLRQVQALDEGPWLHPAQLLQRSRQALTEGQLPLPRRLLLAGLDEIPPLLQALFDEMASAAVAVEVLTTAATTAQVTVLSCADPSQEVRAVAQKIREQAQAGQRIGVVVPQLHAYRPLIERIFPETLSPAIRFDISQGPMLDRHPLIADALHWLALSRAPMTAATAGQILLGPGLPQDPERSARILAELALRQGPSTLSLSALIHHCTPLAPQFAARLRQLSDTLSEAPRRDAAAQWSTHFGACLARLGWPGETPDPHAMADWQQALEALSAMQVCTGAMSRTQALHWLQRICKQRSYQAPAGADAIQVMGMLEVVGLSFDHLYVLGMDDQTLPSAPRPHPLLPLAWQARQRLPHASAEQCLRFAQALWRRLCSAAPQITCTYPRQGAEATLGPSPLLLGHTIQEATPSPPFWHSWLDPAALDHYPDNLRPALRKQAGAGLLRAQANCAFQALAQYRLAAQPLVDFREGVSASDIGDLIHRALQHFWQQITDSLALKDLQVDTRLRRCIAAAMQEADLAIDDIHRQALADSLQQLLQSWLAQESTRPDFTVLSTEQTLTWQAGPLSIRLRPDRLDRQLDGDQRIVIDYKSGASVPALKDWLALAEPQMPLYILASEAQAGVYAKLNREKTLEWQGGGATALWKGIAPIADWPDQQQRWQAGLNMLAQTFADGDQRVNPRKGEQTCEYCQRHALCRIYER